MEKTEASVMIDRPVEEVWKFVTDVEKMPKYETGIIETKLTSSGPLGVGSTSISKRSDGVYTFRCTEFEPNRRFFIEFTSEKGRGAALRGTREGAVLQAMDGKTKLDAVWDLRLHGFYRLLGPMISRSMKKQSEEMVGNIKRMMESEVKT
jgi:carbon monoxide dehydrogenase subunit G